MEKKDIIIIALVVIVLGVRLYMRYTKKKGEVGQAGKKKVISKGGLASQPDDYEPYSGK